MHCAEEHTGAQGVNQLFPAKYYSFYILVQRYSTNIRITCELYWNSGLQALLSLKNIWVQNG